MAAGLAMFWLILAALVASGRYALASAFGDDWDWREEMPCSLRTGGIVLLGVVAASALFEWSPLLFWLVVVYLAGQWAIRHVRVRQAAPKEPQWTEDQL